MLTLIWIAIKPFSIKGKILPVDPRLENKLIGNFFKFFRFSFFDLIKKLLSKTWTDSNNRVFNLQQNKS